MSDDMHTRISRAEWEISALKEGQQRHDDRMTELSTRIDVHHREVMSAIGALRDERAKAEGAAEARVMDAAQRQRHLKWLSFALAAIGTFAALGWLGASEGAMLPVELSADAPMPVQHSARELP